MDNWRGNNFALIRVLASLQVAVMHGLTYFELEQRLAPLRRALQFFPGVPIFFFISGLLVARSFRRSTPAEYFRNRALRIYPALWVCLVATLIPLSGSVECFAPSRTTQWLSWWLAQMSAGQMWTPEFMRRCGGFAFNGGRWTIAVELQFYLLLPLILIIAARIGRLATALFALLAFGSVLFQTWFLGHQRQFSPGWMQSLHLSVLNYLWIFMLGTLAHHHFERIARWFAGKAHWWLLAYVAAVLLARLLGLRDTGNDIGSLSMVVLCALVLSVALSARGLADRLLRGNDFTYGLYLFHPVMLLTVTALGFGSGAITAIAWLLLSCGCAAASWFLVERPFLRRKRTSAAPVVAPQPLPLPPVPVR